MTILTKEHWSKIRENNKKLVDLINKIEIVGITAAEYEKKYPKLAKMINLEEVKKMKLVKQTIKVTEKVGKKKAAAKELVPAGHITPKELATELKTSPKALRKVIRKLNLTRTGKQWHWLPADKEVTQIKDAYLKSTQPATPKPAKKTKVEPTIAEVMAEEEEDEVEEENESDTIIVPPAI